MKKGFTMKLMITPIKPLFSLTLSLIVKQFMKQFNGQKTSRKKEQTISVNNTVNGNKRHQQEEEEAKILPLVFQSAHNISFFPVNLFSIDRIQV